MPGRNAGRSAADALFGGAACVVAWLLGSLALSSALGFVGQGASALGRLLSSAVAATMVCSMHGGLPGPRMRPARAPLVRDGWPSLAIAATLALVGMAGAGVPDVGPVAVGAAAAAVSEEALFRCALLAELAPLGPVAACVGSSAAFAALHALGMPPALGMVRVVLAFAFGLFLASEVWGGGRLSSAVAYHLVFDLALGLAGEEAAGPLVLLASWGLMTLHLGTVGSLRLAELAGGGMSGSAGHPALGEPCDEVNA